MLDRRIVEFAKLVRQAAAQEGGVELACQSASAARRTRRTLYSVRQALIDSNYDMEAAIMSGALQFRVVGRAVLVQQKPQGVADQISNALEKVNGSDFSGGNRLDNAE